MDKNEAIEAIKEWVVHYGTVCAAYGAHDDRAEVAEVRVFRLLDALTAPSLASDVMEPENQGQETGECALHCFEGYSLRAGGLRCSKCRGACC